MKNILFFLQCRSEMNFDAGKKDVCFVKILFPVQSSLFPVQVKVRLVLVKDNFVVGRLKHH